MATPNPRYQHRPGLERAERTSPFTLQSDFSAEALGRKKKITVDFDGDITAKKEFLMSDGTHLELHLRAFVEFMKETTDWGLENNGEWLFKIFRRILEFPQLRIGTSYSRHRILMGSHSLLACSMMHIASSW